MAARLGGGVPGSRALLPSRGGALGLRRPALPRTCPNCAAQPLTTAILAQPPRGLERGQGLEQPPLDSASGSTLDRPPFISDQLVDDDLFKRDELKEGSRKYQRTLSSFTWDRWASHRSTARYVRHMRGLFKSSIVRGLAQPLLYVGGLATAYCVYEELLLDGILPAWLPSMALPTAAFDLTSFALALLLVFRTNTSYDRWDQVCSLWGSVANCSRDIVRMVLSGGLRGGPDSPLPAAVCRWVVAYARSLKAQLTEDSDLRGELQEVLEPSELDALCASWHPPSFALQVLSELMGHARAEGMRESLCMRLDEQLSQFEGATGACERILRTPIPLSYTRHTSRFLVIWLTCLPLGLWSGAHWGTVPLSMVIAFLLLGIEEIGVQIEEPFGLLPLEDMCQEIEGDLFSMLQEARTAKSAAASAAGEGPYPAAGAGALAAAAVASAAGVRASEAPAGAASDALRREQALFSAAMRRKLEGGLPAGGSASSSGSDHGQEAGAPGSTHNGSAGKAGGGNGSGKGSGSHVEWAELGARARAAAQRTAGHSRRSGSAKLAADAIFSSLDEVDV